MDVMRVQRWALFFLCCGVQVVIKEKVLELLLYFTKHKDEEVKTKAIIGLGMLWKSTWR